MMAKSLYLSFLSFSQDFLMLVSKKVERGRLNKTIGEEAITMQSYYEDVESLIKNLDQTIHLMRIELFNSKMTNKMLESELTKLIQASISGNRSKVVKCIMESNFEALDVDIKDDVVFRLKDSADADMFGRIKEKFISGTTIEQITKHFTLSENQFIELFSLQNKKR